MTSEEGPAQKLAALLETLDPADRREITAWLLARGPRGWAGHLPGELSPELRQQLTTTLHASLTAGREVASGLASGEQSQLVTVRLPTAQHERLRDWCAEHNFTMAAVVRGLIERFLDGQDRPAR